MADLIKGINIFHLKNDITKRSQMKKDGEKLIIEEAVYFKYLHAKSKCIQITHSFR